MKDKNGNQLRIGDRIRVVDISDADKDLSTPDDPETRTHELFRFCLGKVFTVTGIHRYRCAEVQADRNRLVRKAFGPWHFIYLEAHEVKLVRRKHR